MRPQPQVRKALIVSALLALLLFTMLASTTCSSTQQSEQSPPTTQEPDSGPSTSREASREQPNVLFILTDDQPYYTLEQMPAVSKKLVGRGTTFENAYVSQSICCPSRASFLTGQYPHNHGINSITYPTGGGRKFHETGGDESTIATTLDEGGYRTGLVGKYMNGYRGDYVPPGWDKWAGRVSGSRELRTNKRTVDIPSSIHPTDYYSEWAMRFLDYSTDSSKDPPFALFFQTNAPHLPAEPAKRHENLYKDARLPGGAAFNEADVSDKPEWVGNLPRLGKKRRTEVREDYRNALRSLRGVDEAVNEMLTLLARRGELENTYVVFTSDHGQHFGEHRWAKERGAKATAYEEAASIPLVIRGPGIEKNARQRELVLNNDLPATLADFAGVSIPKMADGSSLSPLLSGEQIPWRTAIMNERRATHPAVESIPLYHSIVTKRYTYVEYDSGERELYDRRRDPAQVASIHDSANPALVASLSNRLKALAECAGETCRTAEGFAVAE